ncbi:MAG: MarR family transcriptional regulator [Candidatus Omnitrophica bacterium]|nr:MarR family transcriptional regulator [Candidatus Omnitrophota bacterium]
MGQYSLSEFIDKINQIMPVIAREFIRRQAKDLSKEELTFSQFMVLTLLNTEGKMRMKDLADSLKVTTANVTGIVERLIKQKLVERLFDSKDRRVIYINLSPKGRMLIGRIEQNRRRVLTKIFGGLSESERQHYLRILTRIKDIILGKE